MTTQSFNQTIELWLNALEHYSLQELQWQSSPGAWSVGQVYMHLIESTLHFLQQAQVCAASQHNIDGDAASAAISMFANNGFPDAILEGPSSNADTPQPDSIARVINGFEEIKKQVALTEICLASGNATARSQHPGLGYFTAAQWFQFAEMHMRHHFRQKQRIDAALHRLTAKQ